MAKNKQQAGGAGAVIEIDADMANADWIITLQKQSEAEGGPVSDLTLSRRMAQGSNEPPTTTEEDK